MIAISSLVPNANDLLALEVEEVAGVLLTHLNSCYGDPGNSVVQQDRISLQNFLNGLNPTSTSTKSEYGNGQPEVNRALLEAWAWLQSGGLSCSRPGARSGLVFYFKAREALEFKGTIRGI